MISNVARNTRKIIEERCLKQGAIARKSGLGIRKLSALLTGNAIMREEHIKAIAHALEVTTDELIKGKGVKDD